METKHTPGPWHVGMEKKMTLLRLQTGPLPLTGLLIGESASLSGEQLWKVAVYGYTPTRPEYWRKADCRTLTPDQCKAFNIDGWLDLVKRHQKLTDADMRVILAQA